MLGSNHRVRNVPVSSRMTKLHSAISPSMNDQWSGKTLRSCFFITVPSASRSSAHEATIPARSAFFAVAGFVVLLSATLLVSTLKVVTLPETWADRLDEVARRDQIALVVDFQL